MNTSVAEKHPLGALGRFGAVAALHAGALYLIATSLGIVPPLIEKEPPVITLAPATAPPADPPPAPPRPQPHQTRLIVEPPVAPPIETQDDPGRIIAEVSEHPPEAPTMDPPAQTVQMVGVRVDSRHPLTQPAYPMTDIRQGNEGTAEIEVYVLPSGRIGDARIVKSAGSPTLDQSALEEAKRRWRLLPAMRDGEPYAQWHRLKVTFNLRNR